MVKCQWCSTQGEKHEMLFEEKDTGELLKSGKPKMRRKYIHFKCHDKFLKDKEFKQKESQELDELYQYLLKLHNLEALDGRMMERIQDLRNGTIKYKNKKITRYKDGVSYSLMLNTYEQVRTNIDDAARYMQFETKWNEFAYSFAIMERNLNDVKSMQELNSRQQEIESSRKIEFVEVAVTKKVNKVKDDLDISDLL